MATYTVEELIKVGAAPNPDNNTTIAEGRKMIAELEPFMKVKGLMINTTVTGPKEAAMVLVDKQAIPPETPLFLHVQVEGEGGRLVEFGVANWWRIVASHGKREAIIMCLSVANPKWSESPVMMEKTYALPAIIQQPVVPLIDPTSPIAGPPEPDFEAPQIGTGWWAPRVDDSSPDGTRYTSPTSHKVWVKKSEQGLGGLRSNVRWERLV